MLTGLLTLVALPAAAQPEPPPPPPPCTNAELPPPPVDTSEQPPPGQASPEPLPVPPRVVGGARMGDCGLVLPEGAIAPPAENTAVSWVLQDLDTGEVLAAKDPHGRQRPASLIKTLLALVVVKELEPDRMVTPTAEDAAQECTCVGIVAGGQYTVEQLLRGLVMHSGNDVAHALATVLGGVPATVEKMNALARDIGATDTRAATPSGLDGPGMTSSAYDISLIFNQAMKQEQFAEAVRTREILFPGWADKPAFPLYNDNKLLSTYAGFLGGKTGFTDDARHTYVGGAERDGKRLAIVLMRGEQRPVRVSDQAAMMLDYGFALASANPEPVGRIDSADTSVPVKDPDAPANAAEQPTAEPPAEPDESSGTTAIVITLAIIVAGLIAFVRVRRVKRT
ncbi:peptidase M15 [Amycolatopsis antarctica]|uniref:Peptidase M15 n=2 Tax=Amycolatopsis antarctica TaxID=1854586 RepID=A0A263DC78_9PSEU|nr:peptidase M15 [Amycolatopsis antarctica]